MADSLFDNRYRYDFIYPRGRSGETLRAVDSQAEDRPVVIKRPAPNDAPPIRAGQEVSILNERRALMRLSGHPALTELLSDGQFSAGGTTHQYIVMERAEGLIVADEVLRLVAQGERLPELETLVIADRLLDLLNTAHLRDIVYNDVDAKHLFWNRDTYRLKVIDWGNAVFLEGDDVTPQGISRQSDIYQAGEVLYFIVTGGKRPDVPRDAGEDFRVDFGESDDLVPARLQAIISKALHPNPRLRYGFISELRRDLADYRSILERERDSIIARVTERLRRNLSKNDLQNLLATLETARAADPGYPAVRQTQHEISDRLQDLHVAASLDAVRIYLERGNWSRAVEVLSELREKAGAQTAPMVNLLLDCALLLLDSSLKEEHVPPTIAEAVSLIFDGEMVESAQILLTSDTPEDDIRRLQWLLAERISSHVPEALLLRPNLYRLTLALNTLSAEGISLAEARALLTEINQLLDSLANTRNLSELRDAYRTVVDRLSTLNTLLSTVAVQYNFSNRKLPLSSLDRALNAAMSLADHMHVIGKQATSSPRDALSALDSSRAIDPTNSAWDGIREMLDMLYRLLQSYQTYVPAADGSDLDLWLKTTQSELKPFLQSLFDELLANMMDGLAVADKAWATYDQAILQGNRAGVLESLTEAIDAVSMISPTLSGWLNQLRAVLDGTHYIERHALYGGLGRALADGWEAFDRSRLTDAERLGQHTYEIARSEQERFAAQRLRDVSKLARDWTERNGALNPQRTHDTLTAIEQLFRPDELKIRDHFNAQMPSKETFLRAMNKGIIELYQRQSSAALRILAVNYVLLGTLDAHDGLYEDALFWREAAIKTLGEGGAKHALVRTLDELIDRRRDLAQIGELLNGIQTPEALGQLEQTRRSVEENPQAKLVSPAIFSARELAVAVRDWANGDFRDAGVKLESVLKSIDEAQQQADVNLQDYRGWVATLQANATELYVAARTMRQNIEKRPDAPDETIRNAHQKIAQVSAQLIGAEQAATLTQWRDTYERFLAVYSDQTIRRSQKLERFNELFRAMFIDRHPAYPLYRHWFDLVEQSPEFPAPPTDDPTPRLDDNVADVAEDVAPSAESAFKTSRYSEPELLSPVAPSASRGKRPLLMIGGGVLALLVVLGGLWAVLGGQNNDDPFGGIVLTISATPTETATGATFSDDLTAAAGVALDVTESAVSATDTAAPTSTATPTATATEAVTAAPTETLEPSATLTDLPPTETLTPSMTFTPTDTATFTPTFTPTLPPEGLQGTQDLLEVLSKLEAEDQPWEPAQFSLDLRGENWLLGVGEDSSGGEIKVALPPETLERFFGNSPATRMRRIDARMSLLTANPQLLAEEVYFGLSLRRADAPADDPDAVLEEVGLYIQAPSLTTINVYQRVNGEKRFIVQQATNFINANIRLERDTATGAVTMYLNDGLIGQPVGFVPSDVPVEAVLFVRDGGVVVSVTSWRVTLR